MLLAYFNPSSPAPPRPPPLFLPNVKQGPRVRSALSELVTILQAKIVAPKPASEPTAVAKTPATVDGGVDASVPAAASGSQLPEADIAREAGAAVAVAPATERVKVEGGVPATPRAPDVRYDVIGCVLFGCGGRRLLPLLAGARAGAAS